MIDDLRMKLTTTEDYDEMEACIGELAKINTPESILALFRAYQEIDTWCDSIARSYIIGELATSDLPSKEHREAIMHHIEQVYEAISSDDSDTSVNAMQIVRNLEDRSDRSLKALEDIALKPSVPNEDKYGYPGGWKHARQMAILFLDGLSPDRIRDNPALTTALHSARYDENDPIWFCNVCRNRFPVPKELGFICEVCKAEVGVDDDAKYQEAYLRQKRLERESE